MDLQSCTKVGNLIGKVCMMFRMLYDHDWIVIGSVDYCTPVDEYNNLMPENILVAASVALADAPVLIAGHGIVPCEHEVALAGHWVVALFERAIVALFEHVIVAVSTVAEVT